MEFIEVMMNRFEFQRSIRMPESVPLHSVMTKSILFLFIIFSLCTKSLADYYRVTAPNGLNVRTSANKHSEVLGELSQGNVVDVISVENGWANINYNGCQGYVSTSYLEAVADKEKASTSTKNESWNFFSWLFNSEGESAWFTGLKWLFFIGVAFFLLKVAMLVIVRMLAGGIIVGGIALLLGFVINWIGWVETETALTIAMWGWYIGTGLGLLYAILHFGGVIDDAIDTGGSSSSSSSGGLKTASVTDESGTLYNLTQDSPYSECDYTDQFGGRWGRDSSGFYRK